MDIDFLKDRYDFELERKNRLTEALALPVGVLTVCAGANVAMVQSFIYTAAWLMAVFLMSAVAAAVAFYGCVYRLWRACHAQVYSYLPLLSESEQRVIKEGTDGTEKKRG